VLIVPLRRSWTVASAPVSASEFGTSGAEAAVLQAPADLSNAKAGAQY
jgi:hypothetical protein